MTHSEVADTIIGYIGIIGACVLMTCEIAGLWPL